MAPRPLPPIADSLIELVGNTPMVRLPKLAAGLRCQVVAKLEMFNPGGSSKDRPALTMIEAAEARGDLRPGGTIVEPTSGNTGVGLAIAAAQKGYRCVFVMTDKVSPEKVALLKAYGAEVVVCPVAVEPDDPASYYSTAARLVREIPGAYRPNQYANPDNPRAHYETTGPEIWDQTGGRVTHYVAGMGTGGTITGAARYLKERNPAIRVIGADPEGSVFSGGSGRPYLVEGVGEDFWPANVDMSVIDEVVAVSDADSFEMARRAARVEGLLVGGSCGTALAAALRVGERLGPDDLVVVLLPDSGRGYLSRVFDDEWMAGRGFLTECDRCVGAVLATRGTGPELLYVNPFTPARDAIAMMRANGVSQLPVCKNTPPFALAEVSGAVDELALMDKAFTDPGVLSRPVIEVMGPPLPTIGIGQPVERAVALLDSAPALLVVAGGRPLSVLTRTDVLTYLTTAGPFAEEA